MRAQAGEVCVKYSPKRVTLNVPGDGSTKKYSVDGLASSQFFSVRTRLFLSSESSVDLMQLTVDSCAAVGGFRCCARSVD